jgi:hypothetical protein
MKTYVASNRMPSRSPYASIRVFMRPPRRPPVGTVACVVGRELQVEPKVLEAYCFNDLTPVAFDLVLLSAAVAFADRVVSRIPSAGWSRHLKLCMPVSSERWHRPEVHRRLIDTLQLLTGDRWDIRFQSVRSAPNRSTQSVLRLQHRNAVAMPYSDGLDSFAVARLFRYACASDECTLILVTTGMHVSADADQNKGQVRVAVPFRFSQAAASVRLREPSYRTRAFVYGALAGLAVSLAGGTRVIIPESGQSSIGPSLCPVGGEALDLRSHPRFTERLGVFLSLLLEAPIAFEHPRLWSTKGETLQELKSMGLADRWQLTHSCPRSTRDVNLGGRRVHCGICSACLLRRQSLQRAGLSEPETYQWPTLTAPTLHQAAAKGSRGTTHNDFRHAACGALCMESLAALASSESDLALRQAASELPKAFGTPEMTKTKLERMVRAHEREWRAFVAAQGGRSFLQHILRHAP